MQPALLSRAARRLCLLALLPAIACCTSVSVRKVPSAAQYQHWTDAQQQRADSLEGVRFYMPRPFVHVHTPFPVDSEVFLASGVLSSDAAHVQVTSLQRIAPEPGPLITLSEPRLYPAGAIFQTPTPPRADSSSTAAPSATPAITPARTIPPLDTATTERSSPGVRQRSVAVDNAVHTHRTLRGHFDLLFLPDFDEQFVARESAGLGSTRLDLTLGEGWSLQALQSEADSSRLTSALLSAIDRAIQIAGDAASAFATGGTSVGASALSAATEALASPRAGEDATELLAASPGAPVTLRLTTIHYAAPGLYPVLKPRELLEARRHSETSEQRSEFSPRLPLRFQTYSLTAIHLVAAPETTQ